MICDNSKNKVVMFILTRLWILYNEEWSDFHIYISQNIHLTDHTCTYNPQALKQIVFSKHTFLQAKGHCFYKTLHSILLVLYRLVTGGGIFPPVKARGQTGIWQVPSPFLEREPNVLAANITGTFDCLYWMWRGHVFWKWLCFYL